VHSRYCIDPGPVVTGTYISGARAFASASYRLCLWRATIVRSAEPIGSRSIGTPRRRLVNNTLLSPPPPHNLLTDAILRLPLTTDRLADSLTIRTAWPTSWPMPKVRVRSPAPRQQIYIFPEPG
jgi:hypothetical protein